MAREVFCCKLGGNILVDRDNGNALVSDVHVDSVEGRHRGKARTTPRCPEVQEHWLATVRAELDFSSFRRDKRNVGSQLAGQRYLRTGGRRNVIVWLQFCDFFRIRGRREDESIPGDLPV